MSEFQTAVNLTLPNGVPGEIAYGVPFNGLALIPTSATVGNKFGYAYTRTAASDTDCIVGGTGEFAGIAALSKSVIGGAIEDGDSFVIPINTQANFINVGAIRVDLAAAANIGNFVQFDNTTGAIEAIEETAEFTAAQATTVLTVSAITKGSIGIGSVIKLVGDIIGSVISLGTGTGGTGTYNLDTSATVGSAAMTSATVAATGKTLIRNAKVEYANLTAAGVATIKIVGV